MGAHRTAGVDVERSALRPVHFMSQQFIDECPASPVAAPPRGSRCRGRDRSAAPAIGFFERLCNAGWCSMWPTCLRGTVEPLAIIPFACRPLDNITSHLHVEDLKFGWTTFALRDLNRSCRGDPLNRSLTMISLAKSSAMLTFEGDCHGYRHSEVAQFNRKLRFHFNPITAARTPSCMSARSNAPE